MNRGHLPETYDSEGSRACRRRLLSVSALAVCLLALGGGVACGLIDPSFTPVHLATDAQRIVAGKVCGVAQPGRWALGDLRVLKGAQTEKIGLSLAIANARDAKDAQEFLTSSAGADAVLFQGEQMSCLLVIDVWMEVRLAAGGDFQITEFRNQRLPKTYSGAADKFIAMTEYILRDKDADVPVEAGVSWRKHVLVAKLPRAACGIAALPADSTGGARLFVAADGGDRLFVYDKAKERFADLTGTNRLDTASRAFAFADLNRDGRTDLVSWRWSSIRARLGRDDGGFGSPGNPPDFLWYGPCHSFEVLSPVQDGAPGVLIGSAWPHLLTWSDKGWSAQPLPAEAGTNGIASLSESTMAREGRAANPLAAAREAGACIPADWNGDGYVDILQIREWGSLLWPGRKGGFGGPKPCAVKSGGLPARWCLGDFDTDGRLDLLVCGRKNSELWETASNGEFRAVGRYAGSLYTIEPAAADCLATDLNHDGRPDVVILSGAGHFSYHFNRGYRCMADEGDLKLDAEPAGSAAAPEGRNGLPLPATGASGIAPLPEKSLHPVRIAAGDFDGDGALDLAAAYATGEVFCFFNGAFQDASAPPGLRVRLPRGRTGPVTVSVWQGEAYSVCAGTYLVEGCSPATYVSLRKQGACTLKWRWPGGAPRQLAARAGTDVTLPVTE